MRPDSPAGLAGQKSLAGQQGWQDNRPGRSGGLAGQQGCWASSAFRPAGLAGQQARRLEGLEGQHGLQTSKAGRPFLSGHQCWQTIEA
jgi:hypothetical protein